MIKNNHHGKNVKIYKKPKKLAECTAAEMLLGLMLGADVLLELQAEDDELPFIFSVTKCIVADEESGREEFKVTMYAQKNNEVVEIDDDEDWEALSAVMNELLKDVENIYVAMTHEGHENV